GNQITNGTAPLAMAYAGHQFGNFNPGLGDGRAVLLGEIVAPDGARFDLHLKGSGRTPYSRGGDGKAVLGAVLREYIVSEAMAALGIPTTRALAIVTTGERVMRENPEPGAVLARIATSHIRVGTFQYFYAKQDIKALKALLDYTITRHYPEAAQAEVPALAMLQSVMAKQADLVARWMAVGFIHGVMNTDNMTLSGETIDYGPCAYLDEYNPAKVFSSIDRQGRYAFANQPGIAHWNLAQLAQSLLPLISQDPEKAAKIAQETLDGFPELFRAAHLNHFAAKLGIAAPLAGDKALSDVFLLMMEEASADFTLSYRHLRKGAETGDFTALETLLTSDKFDSWKTGWRARLAAEKPEDILNTLQAANPIFIARNHRVEAAIKAANEGDLAPFEALVKVLQTPFTEQPEHAEYEDPPKPDEIVQATFCGT
ncbi:MAG: YdiU family protein, partial [Alphaproteobacteria bacterium]|nr:YdiU family protein [Alphaproteobacteria bacterium]